MTAQTKVAGVILAGGQARRMNFQNKALMPYHGRPLIAYSFEALSPLVEEIWISANDAHDVYQQWPARVIADASPAFLGPLSGVLAAMNATLAHTLIVVPCDAPLMTTPLLARLLLAHQTQQSTITVARCGERVQSVFMVVDTALKANLAAYLAQGERKVQRWFALHTVHYVDFGTEASGFENINTPDALLTTP